MLYIRLFLKYFDMVNSKLEYIEEEVEKKHSGSVVQPIINWGEKKKRPMP